MKRIKALWHRFRAWLDRDPHDDPEPEQDFTTPYWHGGGSGGGGG